MGLSGEAGGRFRYPGTYALQDHISQSGLSLTRPASGCGRYDWRINEHNTDGTVTTGGIWRFSVADYILVAQGQTRNAAALAPNSGMTLAAVRARSGMLDKYFFGSLI